MTTIGCFLHEKLCNMARWITEDADCAISTDIVALSQRCTHLHATMFAEMLLKEKVCIVHRDWNKLHRLVNAADMPFDFGEVVHVVQKNEAMHDKFWRYLELFITIVENNSND